jgi:hypothetical protein
VEVKGSGVDEIDAGEVLNDVLKYEVDHVHGGAFMVAI